MRVTVVAIGSTGDVLPYLGVATALGAAGHSVRVATHAPYRPLVEAAGACFAPLPMDPEAELTPERAAAMRSGPVRAARAVGEVFAPWARPLAFAIDDAADDSDALLLSALAWPGIHSALARGIPAASLHLQPLEPTREHPPAPFGPARWPGALAAAVGRRVQLSMVKPHLDVVNEVRAAHRMPPTTAREHVQMLADTGHVVLHGYSPALSSRPHDWRPGLEVVGYWWPDASATWAPSPELERFVAAGPPPVYIGFGSTSPLDAGALAAVVRGAVASTGMRAVVASGWAGLEVDHPDVCVVDRVDHAWLLPRCAAAVHHAGSGTTGATLRAGIPSVPVPIALDQPFWAARLAAVGVAAAPIPAPSLTADGLAAGLRATTDVGMRERAAALGATVRAERGAAAVVDWVGAHG